MLSLVLATAALLGPHAVAAQGAIIGNGQVVIGVGESGALEVPYRGVPSIGVPDSDPIFDGELLLRSADATRGKLFGEGWGAGIREEDGGYGGYGDFMDVCGATENGLFEGPTGLQNMEIERFRGVDGDPNERADSVVTCGALGLLKIRHQFRSAESRPNCEDAFEVKVSVDNLACKTVGDVIYRRNADPDVAGDTSDFVSISGESEFFFDLASNSLFCGVLPSEDCPTLNGETLPIESSGPFDQGMVLQINLGKIGPGERAIFRFYWGLFESPEAALECVDSGRMSLYATTTDDEDDLTYLLGFRRSITLIESDLDPNDCINWDGEKADLPPPAAPMSAAMAAEMKAEAEEQKKRR